MGRPQPPGIVVTGEQKQPVGVGAGLGCAVIVVADGKGTRKRELEGNVGVSVIAHRAILLDRAPVIHASVVPRQLGVEPGMWRPGHAHDGKVLHCVEPERRDGAALGPVGPARYRRPADRALHKDRFAIEEILPVHHRNREGVTESPYPFQGAKVMVETAVLLRQHDDMLNILQATGTLVGGEGQRLLDGWWKGRKHGTCAGRLAHFAEEVTTAHACTCVRASANLKICI